MGLRSIKTPSRVGQKSRMGSGLAHMLWWHRFYTLAASFSTVVASFFTVVASFFTVVASFLAVVRCGAVFGLLWRRFKLLWHSFLLLWHHLDYCDDVFVCYAISFDCCIVIIGCYVGVVYSSLDYFCPV